MNPMSRDKLCGNYLKNKNDHMKKVLLLLADGFETFEASVFIDVMGWNLVEGDCSTQLFTCGLKKEIKSSFNQRFIVDFLIDDIDVNDFRSEERRVGKECR